MEINTIGVVGSGVMGQGVALTLAAYGYSVILNDVEEEVLQSSLERIQKKYREVQMFNRNFKVQSADALDIRLATDLHAFEEADFIIENITECMDAKIALYKKLIHCCREEVVYAINTSCIPITKIASYCPRPENVLGMHFMNPVPMKKLVEMVRGEFTSEETLSIAQTLLETIDKVSITVNDSPGFVSNRLSHLFMNEAAFLVHEQVSSVKEIDKLFKLGYGHQMGPLETADLIGLDTVLNSLNVLYELYQDSKYRCCPLLRRMVDAGKLGVKSGQGFYHYGQE